MKGLICFYSGMGNTRLACRYLAQKAPSIEWTLHNIVRDGAPAVDAADIVGFATFADYLGPPRRFIDFVNSLPRQTNKPAFVFNTFGNSNGATLRRIHSVVKARGFRVIAGHALHMPESIPTMIRLGLASAQAPNPSEMTAFNRFVAELDSLCTRVGSPDSQIPEFRLRLRERLMPTFPRKSSKVLMGKKHVDAGLCTKCGICALSCPYDAITLNPLPRFDQSMCYGCWACYNKCPTKAIYTGTFRGICHYPEPLPAVKVKLRA
jgi:ferredoxin